MNQPQPQQIQIKADDATLKGVYANGLQIAHSREEVTMDYFNLMPPHGQLVARVIVSPGHAKRIIAALTENLKKYEQQFGKIEPATSPIGEFGFASK